MGLSRNSLHQKIASRLHEEIFAGILAPGSFAFEAARNATDADLAELAVLHERLQGRASAGRKACWNT